MTCTYQFVEGSTVKFKFLEMSPTPQGPRQQHTYLSRANVDEVAIYIDGLRGELFQMSTTADAKDESAGKDLIKAYEEAVGTVLEVIYGGQNYGAYLLDGVISNGYEVLGLIGGLNAPNQLAKFFIESQWTLFPINEST